MLTLVFLLALLSRVNCLVPKKVHFNYPTELLSPPYGSTFSANVTQDKLVCFGNEDYPTPTYLETLYCMFPYLSITPSKCYSVWGSRSVELELAGHVEFLKMPRLPRETVVVDLPISGAHTVELSATRWQQYSTFHGEQEFHREIIQIPAEPIHLCARSADWQGRPAHFTLKFRQAFLRTRDKRSSNAQTLLHIALVAGAMSTWFIPYFTAVMAARLAYEHGAKVMLTLFLISSSVVCLTPWMLTKHNRQLARHYFNYFFTRMQANDTRQQIKKRLPVFQALFFSSLLIVLGFTVSYLAYYNGLLGRESRNVCFKYTLSAAISWFVFSLCRSFERFFRDWLWIAMSVSLANDLGPHLNPLCHNEVVFATMLMSQCVRLLLPRVVQFQFINSLVSAALPKLQGVSARLRIPLPYQIYEHHSLRHLVEGDYTGNVHSVPASPFQPAHLALSSKPLSHMATSTGDLGTLDVQQRLRRGSGSRASLAQIAEDPAVQPLVDYIDEVVEGSARNETEGDVAESDVLSGAEMEGRVGGAEGADQEWGAAATAGSFPAIRKVLSALFIESKEATPLKGDSGRDGNDGGDNDGDGAELVPLADRSDRDGASQATACQLRVSMLPLLAARVSLDSRGVGPGAVAMALQRKNREALRAAGVDVSDLPRFELSPAAEGSEADTEQLEGERSGEESLVGLGGGGEELLWGSLVGAVRLPLSLLGPVRVCPATTGEGVCGERRVWLPLACQDAALVAALRLACTMLRGVVVVTTQAPLESTLSVSAEVEATPVQLQDLHTALLQLSAEGGLGYQVTAVQGRRGHSSRLDAAVAVVQVKVPTDGAARCILSDIQCGSRLLRRVLAGSAVVSCGSIAVNHHPLGGLRRLTAHMHFVAVTFAVCLASGQAADAFSEAHELCSLYFRNAYLDRAVQAVLPSLQTAAVDVSGLLTCATFELQRDVAEACTVLVSGRVPVLLAGSDLQGNSCGAGGESSGAAARRCLSLLTGQHSTSSAVEARGDGGDALSDALAVVVALSYAAFLTTCAQ